jgi:hypothetical protein
MSHEKICGYVMTDCPNGCSISFSKKELDYHLTVCTASTSVCKCGKVIERSQLQVQNLFVSQIDIISIIFKMNVKLKLLVYIAEQFNNKENYVIITNNAKNARLWFCKISLEILTLK